MNTNPWLNVELANYEGHMAEPSVGQAAMLASEFRRAIESCQPRSVALIGCAGGNGLDQLNHLGVRRVVCVDINPSYVQQVRERYSYLPGLETVCSEVEQLTLPEPVDMVFAGLIFEYTKLAQALKRLARVVCPGGRLFALTQMPATGLATVTPTAYSQSLSGVGAFFQYINVEEMVRTAAGHGFQVVERRVTGLPSGKSFAIVEYQKS